VKVTLSDEVKDFLRGLAPEPRRLVLRALDGVESGRVKLQPLESQLEKFYKIKAGRFRVLCAVEANTVFALFADWRSTVYEVASAALLEKILLEMQD